MKTLEELLKGSRMRNCGGGENTLDGLYKLIQDCTTKDTVMVEVGCHRGVSTELFAQCCAKVYAIDPWDLATTYTESSFSLTQSAAHTEFMSRLKDYDNVETIKDFSENASGRFDDESIDMVYIDGDHSFEACTIDLQSWIPKVKKGGIVSGHDGKQHSGVRRAISNVTGSKDCIAADKLYSDTSWKFIKE